MKIISKRGKKTGVEVRELDIDFGIIILDQFGMSPEETKRAEEAMKELRRQLEQLGHIMDTGWYNLPERP